MVIIWILVGLVLGLLTNYLADALPKTRRLSRPLWWPLSLKRLRGYLSSSRVIIVFLVSAVGAGLLYNAPPARFPVLMFAAILVYFLLVTVIDVEHRLVLHPVSLVGVLVLGSIGLWRHGLLGTVFGGVAGFALMLALYFLGDWLGRLMAKMRREKWEETALGFGDVNLAGVIGLLAGWPGVIAALFVGMLAAGLFSGAYLLWMLVSRKYAAFSSIPYAPFLCFGVVFTFSLGIYLSPSS